MQQTATYDRAYAATSVMRGNISPTQCCKSSPLPRIAKTAGKLMMPYSSASAIPSRESISSSSGLTFCCRSMSCAYSSTLRANSEFGRYSITILIYYESIICGLASSLRSERTHPATKRCQTNPLAPFLELGYSLAATGRRATGGTDIATACLLGLIAAVVA